MGAQNHHGVEVYTLSSNSWRRVEMSLGNNVAFNSGNCWPATFVNRALHWLGEVKGGVQLANRDVILSFDVNNDKFGEIALPDGQQLIPQGLVAVPHDIMGQNLLNSTFLEKNWVNSQQQEESYSIAKSREKQVHKAPQRYGFEDMVSFALITSNGDPLSYRDVEEMGSLQKNKTWESSTCKPLRAKVKAMEEFACVA
nr:uncharacterized protein LOC112029626 [Quercus suber]